MCPLRPSFTLHFIEYKSLVTNFRRKLKTLLKTKFQELNKAVSFKDVVTFLFIPVLSKRMVIS